jgi:hypothetical protein
MWRRERDDLGRQLVAECEAFLTGRYAEHLVETGGSIPAWAWTNLLAHGTEEQLRACPARIGTDAFHSEPWCLARRYLAGEVLDLAHRNGPLGKVQAKGLLPLESRLASETSASCSRPGDWVTAVLAALAPLSAWQPARRRSASSGSIADSPKGPTRTPPER